MTVLKPGRPSNRKKKALEDVIDTREITRINANVDHFFYKKLKRFVVEKDTTINKVVIEALDEYMSKYS